MLKRDWLMVQIEELGKAIAQLVYNRKAQKLDSNPELVSGIYRSLEVDRETLMAVEPETLRRQLDGEDKAGLQRMELAAKTLLEESYLLAPEAGLPLRRKAKALLAYVQENDTTFSLERMALLAEPE